jgi:hypothetical protein
MHKQQILCYSTPTTLKAAFARDLERPALFRIQLPQSGAALIRLLYSIDQKLDLDELSKSRVPFLYTSIALSLA